MVDTALIIAAGAGTRLKQVTGTIPKPLLRVAGVPLITRILLTAQKAGITRFVIVTGYAVDQLHATLDGDPQVSPLIEWVHNEQWEAPNGLSVLAARDFLPGPFVLLMADHLFDEQNLLRLLHTPLESRECVLGVDRKLDTIYDIEDATKARVDGPHLVDIGKHLTEYNAVDTGLFLCSPALFDALEASRQDGGCALSDGVRLLARQGRMRACDIEDGFWQDIDTPGMLDHAERVLLRNLRKPTDGVVSRYLNRPVSTRISRRLVRTSISPNQVTMATFLVGLLGALGVSVGTFWPVFWGALLFHAASVLDGCDGEVATLTFRESKYGSWLDTITDNITYVVFIIAVTLGYGRAAADPAVWTVGTGAVTAVVLSMVMMYYYLIHTGESGSLVRYNVAFHAHAARPRRGLLGRVLDALRLMVKRDFFSLLLFVFAVLGRLDWMFWTVTLGGLAMACGVFASTGLLLSQARAAKPQPEPDASGEAAGGS